MFIHIKREHLAVGRSGVILNVSLIEKLMIFDYDEHDSKIIHYQINDSFSQILFINQEIRDKYWQLILNTISPIEVE